MKLELVRALRLEPYVVCRDGGGRAVDHSESDSEIGEGSDSDGDDYGSGGSDGYDADEYDERGMYS